MTEPSSTKTNLAHHIPIQTLTKDDKDGKNLINAMVTVCGWVSSVRRQGKVVFIELHDGSCLGTAQLVVEKRQTDAFEESKKVTFKCSLTATGIFAKTKASPTHFKPAQPEIHVRALQVLGPCGEEYPLVKAEMKMDTLRKYLHLRPRTSVFYCLTKIQSKCMWATHEFFQNREFDLIQLPAITDSACEGGCCPLQVTSLLHTGSTKDLPLVKGSTTDIDFSKEFFDGKRFLTVSAQLHLEPYVTQGGKVYTITRAFRGEPSQSRRHLAEFDMIEWEMAFIRLEDNMKVAEGYVKFCIWSIWAKCAQECTYLQEFLSEDEEAKNDEEKTWSRLSRWVEEPFARTTHQDAVSLLQKEAKENKVEFKVAPDEDEDLTAEHERHLTDVIYKKPVFVMYYPKKVKAFYMPTLPKDDKHVDGFDLLVPGVGEIIGGSMRIDNEQELIRRMDELKMDKDALEWYIALRRFGSVPHGGAGLGFARLIMMLTGVRKIQDCMPYHRTIHDCPY